MAADVGRNRLDALLEVQRVPAGAGADLEQRPREPRFDPSEVRVVGDGLEVEPLYRVLAGRPAVAVHERVRPLAAVVVAYRPPERVRFHARRDDRGECEII